MPFSIGKEDIRIRKTKISVFAAMNVLLERQNFRKITIKDICDEALISRASFYSHFIDKYDLFKYWLVNFIPENINKIATYDDLENIVNQFISKNKMIIKNIIEDADNETLDIVFNFILSLLDLTNNNSENSNSEKTNEKHIVFSNVFVGGIIYYLLWNVKNKFPMDIMNTYLYDIIEKFKKWDPQ